MNFKNSFLEKEKRTTCCVKYNDQSIQIHQKIIQEFFSMNDNNVGPMDQTNIAEGQNSKKNK